MKRFILKSGREQLELILISCVVISPTYYNKLKHESVNIISNQIIEVWEDRWIISFHLASSSVSLMENINTFGCLSSAIVLVGCVGLSPYTSSLEIFSHSLKRALEVLVDQEGSS